MQLRFLLLLILASLLQSCSYNIYRSKTKYEHCAIKKVLLKGVRDEFYNFTVRNDSLFVLFKGYLTTPKVVKTTVIYPTYSKDTVFIGEEVKGIISKAFYINDTLVLDYSNQGFEFSWKGYFFVPDKIVFDNWKTHLKIYYPHESCVKKVSDFYFQWMEYPWLVVDGNTKFYLKDGKRIKFKNSAGGLIFVYQNYMYEISTDIKNNYWLSIYPLEKIVNSKCCIE